MESEKLRLCMLLVRAGEALSSKGLTSASLQGFKGGVRACVLVRGSCRRSAEGSRCLLHPRSLPGHAPATQQAGCEK